MNSKMAYGAVVLGLMCSLLVTRAPAGEPWIVFQDNFDGYTNGCALWGQNGWYNSAKMVIPWYGDNSSVIYKPGTDGAVLMSYSNNPQGFSASLDLPRLFAIMDVSGAVRRVKFDYYPAVVSNQWLAFEPWVAVGPAADFGNDAKNTVLAAMVTYGNWPDFTPAGQLIDVNTYGYAQNTLGTATLTGNTWNQLVLTARRTGETNVQWIIQVNQLTPSTNSMAYDPTNGLNCLQIGYIGSYSEGAGRSLLDNLVIESDGPSPFIMILR